jgi:hypothetical protein
MKTIFLLLAFLINTAFSLDTTSTKYYPLKVGNSWTYIQFYSCPPSTIRIKRTVADSVILNGHVYYSVFYGTQNKILRVDSTTGNLLQFSYNGCQWLNNEILVDSIASEFYDSCRASCRNDFFTICADTSNQILFGSEKKIKKFVWSDHFETSEQRIYVKDIGFCSFQTAAGNGCIGSLTLTGCVIDGIVYGDTSLTGINNVSTEIPQNYFLYQNYPNPFNPVTKIKFGIPLLRGLPDILQTGSLNKCWQSVDDGAGRGVFVKLIIFDILGKEITTLVNQQFSPGTYETEWNGSDYPSGIYFYKLESSNFSETKKMVLIK